MAGFYFGRPRPKNEREANPNIRKEQYASWSQNLSDLSPLPFEQISTLTLLPNLCAIKLIQGTELIRALILGFDKVGNSKFDLDHPKVQTVLNHTLKASKSGLIVMNEALETIIDFSETHKKIIFICIKGSLAWNIFNYSFSHGMSWQSKKNKRYLEK